MSILARRRQAACGKDACAIMAALPKEQQYFHIIPYSNGTVAIKIQKAVSTANCSYIAYSNNCGKSWTTVNNVDNQEVLVNIPAKEGKPICFKGDVNNSDSTSVLDCVIFASTGPTFTASGNISSISLGDNFVGQLIGYKVAKLFCNCKNLIDASTLYLPSDGKYRALFSGCTKLTQVPRIVVNSIPAYSMQEMFQDTKISECTIISKGTVGKYWSSFLFSGATNLTSVYLYASDYGGDWNAVANTLNSLQTSLPGTIHLGGTFWGNRSYTGIPSNWTMEQWQTSDIPELNDD